MKKLIKNNPKLQVEIWSDVMCPFCYIGKRHFEKALGSFEHPEDIQVIWKSFQLNPDMRFTPGQTINDYLSEKKGITVAQARQMNERVTEMAAKVGLRFETDRCIPANSFDAHRLSHLALEKGLQDQLEERLFLAYFSEGKNIEDRETLKALAVEVGLSPEDIRKALENEDYAEAVRADIADAEDLGARGVPFFVLDRKIGVSGAQPTEVFSEALKKAWGEWKKENPLAMSPSDEGAVCGPDGKC